jgi:hypothetical protein
MAELAEKLLTFEEFTALALEGGHELVNGRVEALVAPRPFHGWTGGQIVGRAGSRISKQTIRRLLGELSSTSRLSLSRTAARLRLLLAADAARHLDLQADRVLGVPTLVVEVVSSRRRGAGPGDQAPGVCAGGGSSTYWILDPHRRPVLSAGLRGKTTSSR